MRNPQLLPEMTKALTEFNKVKAAVMILDLRGAIGGSGETAAQVAALFLSQGEVCHVRKRSKGQESKATYVVRDHKLLLVAADGSKDIVLDGQTGLFNKKVLILVDKNTSGAAEIIASALQENGRAKVYGMATAGKNTGQTYINLGHGYVLRLSTTAYTTAKQQPMGVKPNVVVEEADGGSLYDKALQEAQAINKQQATDTKSVGPTADPRVAGPTASVTSTAASTATTSVTSTANTTPTTSVTSTVPTTSAAPAVPTTSVTTTGLTVPSISVGSSAKVTTSPSVAPSPATPVSPTP
jgi:C-terminal processing protease CtpA/Prc